MLNIKEYCSLVIKYIEKNKDNLVIHKTKQGYLYLLRKRNRLLFLLLDKAKCFNFYETNNGSIIYLHQIIAYINFGYKAFINGYTAHKDLVEVHHINSCITDNRPDNLTYLSPQDNLLIAHACRTNYHGYLKSSSPTPFNKNGQEIKNHTHFLIAVMKKSLQQFTNFIGLKIKISYRKLYETIPLTILYIRKIGDWYSPYSIPIDNYIFKLS